MAHPRLPTIAASTASLRVEPTGSTWRSPRDYLITLELSPSTHTTDGVARAHALAAGVLCGVSSGVTATDQPALRELRSPVSREPGAATQPSGVSGAVLCADWPARAVIARMRTELIEGGYEVSTAARRVCAEPGCTADAVVPWTHADDRPREWYSERICGRHNYRACTGCGSVFKLVSSNATGPAPSVPCPVCHVLLVEWGGTKHWEVELVSANR